MECRGMERGFVAGRSEGGDAVANNLLAITNTKFVGLPYFAGIMPKYFYLYILLFICIASCTSKVDHLGDKYFEKDPVAVNVHPMTLIESSGIADSKANPGHLWVEQDSGNPPFLYLLKHDGTVVKSIFIGWSWNWDWEDLALSGGPEAGKNYLYIADIGDNVYDREDYAIFRFEEPKASADTVFVVDRIAYNYPDGRHNSEAMLVDPDTHDIYIITKTDDRSKIFQLKYPYKPNVLNTVQEVGELPYNYAVSAAISAAGDEIVIKTYDYIFYYQRKKDESILKALQNKPITLPYVHEPQGEAITFAVDNSGFFTLSEKSLATSVKLYFYKRK